MTDQNYIEKTPIPGLLIIKRPTFSDDRGYFREVLRMNELQEEINFKFDLKQWSHSFSNPKVLRGLHCEDQNKIVYPLTGKIFAAYADTRPESPTFAKVFTVNFEEPNDKAIFVPKGVANSFCVIGDKPAHFLYLIDEYYSQDKTKGITWNDPDLNINWPIKDPIISERDKENPTLREVFSEKFK